MSEAQPRPAVLAESRPGVLEVPAVGLSAENTFLFYPDINSCGAIRDGVAFAIDGPTTFPPSMTTGTWVIAYDTLVQMCEAARKSRGRA